MKYKTRVTQLTVLPEGDPLFSEKATFVSMVDEAAGEFVEVVQHLAGVSQVTASKIQIDSDEWPALKKAIDDMLGSCAKD